MLDNGLTPNKQPERPTLRAHIHSSPSWWELTYWGRVTHICVSKLTIIGTDNSLSPSRRQAIIWTNAGLLKIGPSGTNFSEILITIFVFSFKKMHFKVSSVKRRPFCLSLNVLNDGSNRGDSTQWSTPIPLVFADHFTHSGRQHSRPQDLFDWRDFMLTHEAETKWTPFRRRYFQMRFHEWKCFNCD